MNTGTVDLETWKRLFHDGWSAVRSAYRRLHTLQSASSAERGPEIREALANCCEVLEAEYRRLHVLRSNTRDPESQDQLARVCEALEALHWQVRTMLDTGLSNERNGWTAAR